MKELILKAGGQKITVYADESELAKLTKPERARTGYERVVNGKPYYATRVIDIGTYYADKSNLDRETFGNGNYVNDRQLCKDRQRARALHDRLVQWQALNDEPVDWGIYGAKYRIDYDYYFKRLCPVKNTCHRAAGAVYFSTEEKAQGAINVFQDELVWYYTKYRSRLDERRTEAAE